jgi:hypothetical protein
VRPLDGCFMLLACLGFAGCAYGSDADGVGVGPSPIVANDAEPDALSSGDTAPAADAGDSGTPQEDTGTFDTAEPIDTARPEPDSSSACTLDLPTGIPACDSCLSASCCAADDTCGTDPACMMFDECISECEGVGPDSGLDDGGELPDAGSCITACETAYPTGASELEALDSCLEGTCASACGAL